MATKKKPAPAPDASPADKKKGSSKKGTPKADAPSKKAEPPKAEPEPTEAEDATEPAPPPEEPATPAAEPEPEPEVITFARDAERRSDEEDKAIRSLVKRGEKALDIIRDVLSNFEPGPERAVKNALKRLGEELDGLKPPEPRKCKEYKRALGLARRGEMGIHPDDIMKYCRCDECHALRDKAGLPHPPPPKMV